MEDKIYAELITLRLERAKELLAEAKKLLADGSYKSANNRAYYSMEKAVSALLISKHIEPHTHNGILKMFNVEYVRAEEAYFTYEDYRLIAGAERIRNSSDYDDFYIANKEECAQQVENAGYFLNKVSEYFRSH